MRRTFLGAKFTSWDWKREKWKDCGCEVKGKRKIKKLPKVGLQKLHPIILIPHQHKEPGCLFSIYVTFPFYRLHPELLFDFMFLYILNNNSHQNQKKSWEDVVHVHIDQQNVLWFRRIAFATCDLDISCCLFFGLFSHLGGLTNFCMRRLRTSCHCFRVRPT